MILFFRNFSPIHLMISPQNQIHIQLFFIPWIRLWVLFPKISNCLLSIHISSFNLIKFEEIIRNYLNSFWIQPLFTTIPLNLWLVLKIGEFGIYFHSWLCVFNDLVVLICQRAPTIYPCCLHPDDNKINIIWVRSYNVIPYGYFHVRLE